MQITEKSSFLENAKMSICLLLCKHIMYVYLTFQLTRKKPQTISTQYQDMYNIRN